MEDTDGGLHPAVDGQSLDETRQQASKIPFFLMIVIQYWYLVVKLWA